MSAAIMQVNLSGLLVSLLCASWRQSELGLLVGWFFSLCHNMKSRSYDPETQQAVGNSMGKDLGFCGLSRKLCSPFCCRQVQFLRWDRGKLTWNYISVEEGG